MHSSMKVNIDTTDISTIEQLHTSCKDCIFAMYNKYDEDQQIDCEMDRLALFEIDGIENMQHQNPDIEVVPAYDNKKEFYVLNNTKCHYKRTAGWAEKVKKENWYTQVDRENRIKYQAIIFVTHSFNDLKLTIQSLLDQEIPPQYLNIIRPTTNLVRPTALVDYFNTTGLPWTLDNVVDTELSHDAMIDNVINNCSFPYYAICHAGEIIPQDYIGTINEKIYDDNLKFAILTHNDQPIFVSFAIHSVYNGNSKLSLLEKLRNDQCNSLIMDIQTIRPNYPL